MDQGAGRMSTSGEADVYAPPIVIPLETAIDLWKSELPVQEFTFIAPRSITGALQVTSYPPGSYVEISVLGTEFTFLGVVTSVDYRNSAVTVVV
jgi:hypothetical protein